MRKLMNLVVATLLVGALPLGAAAMDHQQHGGSMDMNGKQQHGSMNMEGMDHGGMSMGQGAVMLGKQTVEGVTASAHLYDIGQATANSGMKASHHFMVGFVDAASGKPMEDGTVAVKVAGPEGYQAGPVQLMPMGGELGANLTLPEKGAYEFAVGSKLADGKTRQFKFSYLLK